MEPVDQGAVDDVHVDHALFAVLFSSDNILMPIAEQRNVESALTCNPLSGTHHRPWHQLYMQTLTFLRTEQDVVEHGLLHGPLEVLKYLVEDCAIELFVAQQFFRDQS